MLLLISLAVFSGMKEAISPVEVRKFWNLRSAINTPFREICFPKASARERNCQSRWRVRSGIWRSSKPSSARPNPVNGKSLGELDVQRSAFDVQRSAFGVAQLRFFEGRKQALENKNDEC